MKLLEIRTNAVFTNINNPKRKTVTYLTLKFPVNSNRFKKYLFVLYDYNSNSILVRPANARTEKNVSGSSKTAMRTYSLEVLIQCIWDWTNKPLLTPRANSNPTT